MKSETKTIMINCYWGDKRGLHFKKPETEVEPLKKQLCRQVKLTEMGLLMPSIIIEKAHGIYPY